VGRVSHDQRPHLSGVGAHVLSHARLIRAVTSE
jgi:hypothetical protein